MITINPQNRSALLEKYDRPSKTLYPCSCSLYRVQGTSVSWSILDLTQVCECDIALEWYCLYVYVYICVNVYIGVYVVSKHCAAAWQKGSQVLVSQKLHSCMATKLHGNKAAQAVVS